MFSSKEGVTELTHEMVNHGDKLVVTISGDKEELAMLEKKLGMLLTSSDAGSCCGGGC